ncbi:MAG: bifunctional UDP-sugar hydrolase/5'-nucleotidase [Treponemataceae bacterium]|nr:MAG: bifunctional UDP-sugar hydrolase/5'-nucleotidase [Treponemataceae bacterium]
MQKATKFWRNILTAGFAAAVLIFTLSCGAKPVSREAGKTYELVIMHTNDHHGSTLANQSKGGLAERATFIKSVRAEGKSVLLLDAGDFNTGSALSNMFDAAPDIVAYNMMGYDAATFGNHEFDGDLDKLVSQIATADYPFVSSNVKTADGSFLGGHQYIVKEYDGIRVGIFGLTTCRTPTIASPDASLTFLNEIDAARDAVKKLRKKEKVDIVIALTHIGDVKEDAQHITSPEVAAAVAGIDIIVDGHSHSFFEKPLIVIDASNTGNGGNTYIVSANEWGKYVGKGNLSVVDGKLTSFDWQPIEITGAQFEGDAEIANFLQPFVEKANASLKEVVGQAAEEFAFGARLPRYGETALGNMICDANAWYIRDVFKQEIDFAFHNGGNIRAALPAGPITMEQVLTILPFENYLWIASLKGSQLQEFFDFIATVPQGAGGFPQFSKEVRYTVDKTAGDGVITDLTIGGQAIDSEKTYRFCTNDYLLKGGDGYVALTKTVDPLNTSLLLSYTVCEYIKHIGGTISPALDGRMSVVGGITP